MQSRTPLQNVSGKENIQPEHNVAFPVYPKLKDDRDAITQVEGRVRSGDEDAEKLVAEGWRDRYSLKPQAAATHLASLINKANPAPAAVMRTPLQRIGANAMQGAGRATPRKTPTIVREAKKSSLTLSPQKFAMDNPRTGAVVGELAHRGPMEKRDATEEVEHSEVFDKFLYTPS